MEAKRPIQLVVAAAVVVVVAVAVLVLAAVVLAKRVNNRRKQDDLLWVMRRGLSPKFWCSNWSPNFATNRVILRARSKRTNGVFVVIKLHPTTKLAIDVITYNTLMAAFYGVHQTNWFVRIDDHPL